MKFKLDENMPLELAADLRDRGYDSDTVIDEGLRGAKDPTVVEAAFVRERLHGLLDANISGRLTVVGPSRIHFR